MNNLQAIPVTAGPDDLKAHSRRKRSAMGIVLVFVLVVVDGLLGGVVTVGVPHREGQLWD